jgi:hypothetical protein
MRKALGTGVKRHAVTCGTAAIVVMSAAGCGGGDDADTRREAIKTVSTTADAPRESGASATGTRRAEPGRASARESDLSGRSGTARVGARPPKNGRDAAVAAVARVVFERYGFSAPGVTVTASGTGVRAAITAREACTAGPSTEARLTALLLKAVPWLRTARVVVPPSSSPLSAYVQGHCHAAELPRATGTVLLQQRGTGLATTASFTVRSSRWSVDFVNGGKILQVSVMRGGAPDGTPLRAVGRGSGRHTFAGAGKARLRIVGTGEWVVRVRDGG